MYKQIYKLINLKIWFNIIDSIQYIQISHHLIHQILLLLLLLLLLLFFFYNIIQ
jgi:hypothetical protein